MKAGLKVADRQILGALIMTKEKGVEERTAESIATLTGLPKSDVRRTLAELEKLQPPLVHRDFDSALGVEFWLALERAITIIDDTPKPPVLTSDRFDVAWSATPKVLTEQLASVFGDEWNDPIAIWRIKCNGVRASFDLIHTGSPVAVVERLEKASFVDVRVVPPDLSSAF
jgi:hypothetical protein